MTLRRTLKRSLSTTTRGLLQFGGGGAAPSYDTDAQTYITAVETADGQSLETGVKDAINAFVVGCKSDGIWTAIKASCILAGARTLTGALVPLVGAAPTNNNFVSGDYSRTAGLTGDGSTKYLATNTLDSDYPQNNFHQSIYTTSAGTTGDVFGINPTTGADSLMRPHTGFFRGRVSDLNYTHSVAAPKSGLIAFSRSTSTAYLARFGGTTDTVNQASATPQGISRAVFANNAGAGAIGFADATITFYSIGESLDLALLDTRVTNLITAIGAAIP